MIRWKMFLTAAATGLVACIGQAPDGGGSGGDPAVPDAGSAADAGDQVAARCQTDVRVPVGVARPVEIISTADLAAVADRMPCITDVALRNLIESPQTLWYDHASIVPGYQDSFGDNVVAPIGMRPNTIRSSLIDTAVPGGHAQIFKARGQFHFPFGQPLGTAPERVHVVEFWRAPKQAGEFLPVVWYMREPNDLTHRLEWLFPVGTVLGEVLFQRHGDQLYPFEIRTRTREATGWSSDAFRPFPTAESLAAALEEKRGERASWQSDPAIDALIAHLRDPDTLEPVTVTASHFSSAFPALDGAVDLLPGLDDSSILEELLMEVPFRSARNAVWKSSAGLRTYAASTDADFSIVPPAYNGGLIEVDDEACSRCHQDAGRPFKDWYDNILAYGELWGQDESFSWHPFESATFVDDDGSVVDFNYDNRTLRQDFIDAGLLAPYEDAQHGDDYQVVPRAWKDYAY